MKRTLCVLCGLVTLAGLATSFATEDGFKSLFNGKDLTGWAGRPNHWSVQDGAITGVTTKENPAQGNNFLIAKDGDQSLVVGDFELRFSYKFTGPWGNSGLQFRSVDKGNFVVNGYQADFEVGPTYSGILYEEGGRDILCERGQRVVIKEGEGGKPKIEAAGSVGDTKEIQAAIKTNDWNDYVVIATGNHIQQFINGKQTIDVTDEQASKAAKSGILAFQIHAGPPMKVQFKNVRIKTLSGADSAAADLRQMQGDWVVAELVANGDKVPDSDLASLKLQMKGNEYSVNGPEGQQQGTLKLNDRTNPKSMDVTSSSADEVPAIYEITGDTFRVCYAPNGGSRPTEFKSTDGSGITLITFKRKQK
jgi:uncharacterized protein (TIGR03067 family)